jgi:hypothetical protein
MALIDSAVYYGHWLDPAGELVEAHGDWQAIEAFARDIATVLDSHPD